MRLHQGTSTQFTVRLSMTLEDLSNDSQVNSCLYDLVRELMETTVPSYLQRQPQMRLVGNSLSVEIDGPSDRT